MRAFIAVLLTAVLSACGGGGGGSGGGGNTPPPAPSGLSYPAPSAWVVGTAITTLTPTVSGTVSTYGVSPTLPAGISLNTSSGAITGTPTTVASAANYVITASNASGSATATVSITVNDVAPTISYGTNTLSLTTGVPLSKLTPTRTGGAPTTWSINPALPSGLTFSTTDGSIEGTPTATAASAQYVVMASNSGGQSQVTLTAAVVSGVLFTLGNTDKLEIIRLTSTRALTLDETGHWGLWNLTSTDLLAYGITPLCIPGICDRNRPVALAGQTVVIEVAGGLELRAASDGHVVASISTVPVSWRLASDGSYVAVATATGLSAWSSTGTALFTRAGDYAKAVLFAAPGEIRVGRGAAGDDVIETITTAGVATNSPTFQGTFHSWFVDGNRFITNLGKTVWIYSKAAVQESLISLPSIENMGGSGGWFWSNTLNTSQVNIYPVMANPVSAGTYGYNSSSSTTRVRPSGTQLALLEATANVGAHFTVVDLSGATLSSAEYSVPIYLEAYGSNEQGAWIGGTYEGALLGGASLSGTRQYFGYGKVLSIAGNSERFAVATASGKVLTFNSHTRAREETIDFMASNLALSSQGTVLAAYTDRTTIRVYSLPGAAELYTWQYPPATSPYLINMALSGSGSVLEQTLVDGVSQTITRQVSPATGGGNIWSDTAPYNLGDIRSVQLSPDGTLIAATEGKQDPSAVTKIYKNGVLTTAVAGVGVVWLDDSRLLATTWDVLKALPAFKGAVVYSSTGSKISSPPLPALFEAQVVDADLLYSSSKNSIYSLTTGAPTWTSVNTDPYRAKGTVANGYVIFTSDATVRAEPR